MNRQISKIELGVGAVLALFLIVVFPALNAAGLVSNFTISLWGKYLCYGILAISVDLLWGYTGLLSLGQALFFSLGGYMMGMYLMLMIGKLGQYHSDLPDFMVFLGHTFLPSFWKPFYSFSFAVTMVFLLPGLLALAFGFLAFRSRIKGVYFSILTQALTYGAALMFFQNEMPFLAPTFDVHHTPFISFTQINLPMGGNNGFTDFKFILGYNLRQAATQRSLYICTALLLALIYVGCRWLTTTKFGLVQRAIRDSENRVLFSGYAAANFKLFVFVASALIASLAGALYVPQVGIINPSEMWPDKSLEVVVWVAVGGRGTLVGPILGAVFVNALKSWATNVFPDAWLIVLGVLFMLAVLFMPEGLIVCIPRIVRHWFKTAPNKIAYAAAAVSAVAAQMMFLPKNLAGAAITAVEAAAVGGAIAFSIVWIALKLFGRSDESNHDGKNKNGNDDGKTVTGKTAAEPPPSPAS
jgi:ABC-type branched-subunit amino acid transport system permease subunit